MMPIVANSIPLTEKRRHRHPQSERNVAGTVKTIYSITAAAAAGWRAAADERRPHRTRRRECGQEKCSKGGTGPRHLRVAGLRCFGRNNQHLPWVDQVRVGDVIGLGERFQINAKVVGDT